MREIFTVLVDVAGCQNCQSIFKPLYGLITLLAKLYYHTIFSTPKGQFFLNHGREQDGYV